MISFCHSLTNISYTNCIMFKKCCCEHPLILYLNVLLFDVFIINLFFGVLYQLIFKIILDVYKMWLDFFLISTSPVVYEDQSVISPRLPSPTSYKKSWRGSNLAMDHTMYDCLLLYNRLKKNKSMESFSNWQVQLLNQHCRWF